MVWVLEKLSRIASLDRRWVFLVMGLAVILPFLMPMEFRALPSQQTLRFVRGLDKAIESSKPLIVCIDYGPQTVAELEPIAMGVMNKIFASKKKVIFMTLYPESVGFIRGYLTRMEKRYGVEYGKDYVFLGLAAAYTTAIYEMGTNIENYFHEDDRGNKLRELPLMRNVVSIKDVSAVVEIASNMNPQHWITYGVTPFGFDFLMACTAVQATRYFPYIQTGQVKGLLAGGRAGAEYEGLLLDEGVLDRPGDAIRGLGSHSMSMGAILLLIILGNIGHFAGQFGRSRSRS